MDDKLKELLNGIGAIAEIGGLMRDSLVDNGFTREEACKIVSDFLIDSFRQSRGNE